MQTLAEQLMAGPRGRRVCLDAVSFTDQDVIRAEFDLRFVFDPAPTVRLRVGDGGGSPTDADTAMGTLRSALAAVTSVDDHFVNLALVNAVDMAMYWQEPDGMEILASRPELMPELTRLAPLVAASPVARWWTDPLAADQFQVRMDGWRTDAVRAPAAQALSQWAEDTARQEARAAAEWDPDPRANISAWWPSTPPSFELTATCGVQRGVPTGLCLVEDGLGETRASVHRVMGSGRVFEIDSASAWAELCREHPMEVTASKRHDWYRTTGLADTRWVMPDWASVAQVYDAVHLQVGAYLAASGTAIEVEPGVHAVIAGWAPGDTFWLTDVVDVEPRGRIFVKDRDDDLWHAEEEVNP